MTIAAWRFYQSVINAFFRVILEKGFFFAALQWHAA
tara:strand:+ start:21018 stop:21125 length:108 start_codon:yes stop_codon:yes gene_type:complete